jgi:hypothetical protein
MGLKNKNSIVIKKEAINNTENNDANVKILKIQNYYKSKMEKINLIIIHLNYQ